jgi:hypothetical protein
MGFIKRKNASLAVAPVDLLVLRKKYFLNGPNLMKLQSVSGNAGMAK